MPPPTDLRMPCSPLTLTTESYNATAKPDIDGDDLNALLYIVVTLLFYSLGIVVGIITYLKREKREMEESKTFEMFMSLKNDPFAATKQRRVQIVTEKLEQLERARAAKVEMERREREGLMVEHEEEVKEEEDVEILGEGGEEEKEESVQLPADDEIPDRPGDLNVDETITDVKDDAQKLQPKKQGNVFQVSPSGEPISSVVAKIFDTERRGGLPNSPKALHLFNSRGRLSRDQSIDSPNRGRLSREQSVDRLSNNTTDSKATQPEPDGCLVTNV